MRIVLFDIDGTLISKRSTEPQERERFRRGVLAVVGTSPPIVPWRYDGMVDPEICRKLLMEVGLSANAATGRLEEVVRRVEETYLEMDKHPILNSGVEKLLRILSVSPNHKLGVVTGNLCAVAEEKLRITDIRARFVEVFCSDGYFDRSDLVKDAVRLCMKKYRVAGVSAFTVVGDTPRDVQAANANGLEAVAVSSGFYSAAELKRAGAKAVFSTLEPSDRLLNALHFK